MCVLLRRIQPKHTLFVSISIKKKLFVSNKLEAKSEKTLARHYRIVSDNNIAEAVFMDFSVMSAK